MGNLYKAVAKPAQASGDAKTTLPSCSAAKLNFSPRVLRSLLMLLVIAATSVAAFCWGRMGGASQAIAQGPGSDNPMDQVGKSGTPYDQRVVGWLYDNIPITRAELGEYLIARFGAERLDFLINRRIVDMACQAKGIFVTDQEVDYSFSEDLKQFRMSQKDFTNHILKKFNKSLYEWKEDVIRPKLALQKLCRPLVVIDDADLQKAFESKYGPKVQCRMIVIQKGDVHRWEIQQRACRSEADFDELAAKQFIPNLAAQHGRLPEPIHKHFGEPIEQKAFALKVGQVSELIEMKDGTFIVLKCDAHIPADQTKQFSQERERLYREIFEGKLGQKMQEHFAELKRQANPRNLIAQHNPTEAESAVENVSASQGSQQSKK